MAEKEDRKSKRSQNTQKTPESRNISSNKFEGVYLEAPYTMNNQNIRIQIFDLTELYVFLNHDEFHQIDPNDPASSFATSCFQS